MTDARPWKLLSWASLALGATAVVRAGHRAGGDTDLYIQGADALIGRGSYEDVPYPPGFPLLLAPFRALDLPVGAVAVASSLVLVGLVWWLSVRLGGPVAGIAAGLILTMSPIFADYGALVMSDAPAAAFVVGGLIAATAGRWWLCGVLFATSAWVRISHAFFLAAMPRWRAFLVMVCSLAPLVLFNLFVYGSPSGYPSGAAEFGLRYLTGEVWLEVVGGEPSPHTNLYVWPAILFGRFGLLVPLLPAFAAVELWHRREDPVTRLAVGIVVINVVTHWFYFFQSARFMLPSAAILVAYTAALAGRLAAAVIRLDEPKQSSRSSVASL